MVYVYVIYVALILFVQPLIIMQLQIIFQYYDRSNLGLMLTIWCNRPKSAVRIESHKPNTIYLPTRAPTYCFYSCQQICSSLQSYVTVLNTLYSWIYIHMRVQYIFGILFILLKRKFIQRQYLYFNMR